MNRRKRSDAETKDLHKLVERKRTKRLNDEINTLHDLLKSNGIDSKKDKISVLTQTIQYIKHLKEKINEKEKEKKFLNTPPRMNQMESFV